MSEAKSPWDRAMAAMAEDEEMRTRQRTGIEQRRYELELDPTEELPSQRRGMTIKEPNE